MQTATVTANRPNRLKNKSEIQKKVAFGRFFCYYKKRCKKKNKLKLVRSAAIFWFRKNAKLSVKARSAFTGLFTIAPNSKKPDYRQKVNKYRAFSYPLFGLIPY